MKELQSRGGWSKKWIKIFLCMTCTMLCYMGVLLLTIGMVCRWQYENLDGFIDIRMYRLMYFLMLVGTLCLVLAFVGFLGTWKQNIPILYTFCSLLVVFSLMEGTVAFIGYTQRNNIEFDMNSNLWEAVNQYPNDVTWQPYVDELQTQLQCCGVRNYTDWLAAMPPEDISEDDIDLIAQYVPLSCCDPTDNARCKIFRDGCHSQLYEIFYETGKTVVMNTLAAVALQLCGAALAFYLLRKLRIFVHFDGDLSSVNSQVPFAYSKLENMTQSTGKM